MKSKGFKIMLIIGIVCTVLLTVTATVFLIKDSKEKEEEKYKDYISNPHIEQVVIDREEKIKEEAEQESPSYTFDVSYEDAELVTEYNVVHGGVYADGEYGYQMSVMVGAMEIMFEQVNELSGVSDTYEVTELVDKAINTASVNVKSSSNKEFTVYGDILEGHYTIVER